tara:strand:+ start:72 stop:494 length:423 start_codon:yes stop_codon:yes gene_type:complete
MGPHTIFFIAPDCSVGGCPQPVQSAKHRAVAVLTFNRQAQAQYARHHPGQRPPDARMEPACFVCAACMGRLRVEDVVDDASWLVFARHCFAADIAGIVPTRDSAVLGFSNLDVRDPALGVRPTLGQVFGLYEEERHALSG